MVSDLDRDDATDVEHFDLRFEMARTFFDLGKFSDHFAARAKDCGRIFRATENLAPGIKQRVTRFHLLREQLPAGRFRARFPT